MLNPALFPSFPEFFESHAHLTLFPELMAGFARVVPLSWEGILFLWQFTAIFLLLLGCWVLSECWFNSAAARWAGVAFVAALLTLPVAGTALYVIDQYINPRNLAAFCGVFVVGAALVHPLMAFFSLSFCVLLILLSNTRLALLTGCTVLPFGLSFARPS